MRGGRRGPQRRHGIADTVLGQRDNVHVAFDDDRRIFLAQCGARLRQAEQLPPLFEQRCFRRVEVFGLAFAQYAPAKSDHFAFRVHDREHHPIAETVV